MTPATLVTHPEQTLTMALAGLGFGLLYFLLLRHSLKLLAGGRGWFRLIASTVGRLGAAVAFLLVVARLGAAPLLAAFMGLLLARALSLRAARRTG